MKINEILSDLMFEQHLDITALSKLTGLQYKLLDNYVKGIYNPNLKNAIILADFFNCSIDYLLGIKDTETFHQYTTPVYKFYERYLNLLKERKISHYKVSKDLSLNINNSRKWKEGKIPTLKTLILLSEYFAVSIDFLIGRNIVKKAI